MKKEEIVVPGEDICIIEEFIPKEGVKAGPDGRVYSILLGKPIFDIKNHEIYVEPVKTVESIRKGDYVVAEVKNIQDRIAIVKIIGKISKGPLKYSRTAVIVGRRNGELDEMIGIGDIIVGFVANVKNGMITLDIYNHNCGVLIAKCNVCNRPLIKRGRELYCNRCKRVEKRKILIDYGNINKLLNSIMLVK